jgi:fumarate reductase iron-sulfur subunit
MRVADQPTMRVSVVRREPGEPERTETYDVPYGDRTSVLDALDWIKDHAEPGLTFRWSCRMAVCGSCGVMVNGRPVLGCETFVRGYRTTGITVGPLAHFEVLRDLVVDTDDFLGRLRSLSPWLIEEPDAAVGSSSPARQPGEPNSRQDAELGGSASVNLQTPGQLAAFRDFATCIDCMLCYSACPQLDVAPLFVGPAAIATARRWDLDSRDHGDVLRMAAMADDENGLWPCVQNGACTAACPKEVDPARAIRDAQREAMG